MDDLQTALNKRLDFLKGEIDERERERIIRSLTEAGILDEDGNIIRYVCNGRLVL